jgi:hypothetical protein
MYTIAVVNGAAGQVWVGFGHWYHSGVWPDHSLG